MHQSTLSPAARAAFASAIGDAFVSTDKGILGSYSWNSSASGKVTSGGKFAKVWPIAVVLPGSTEEVAAVVRACCAHGLHFRAHSTGYGSMHQVGVPNAVAIDLRRMSHLEIDVKNRMAIIDPYVTAGVLQAEAFKHGLTCHIVGAGPAHSPLASATSMLGIGITSNATSMNVRNLLSWEWVSPTGEILRGGAAGSSAGWFASDGPGPGFRGMIRGMVGAMGSLGVFTRIGFKLYPWPDHQVAQNTGALPQIGMKIPSGCELYHAVWDSWEDQRDAVFKLTDANVAFSVLRVPPDHIGWILYPSNGDYVRAAQEGCLPEVASPSAEINWTVLTTSWSAAEAAWKDRVVRDIVSSTRGRLLKLAPDHKEMLFRHVATSHYVSRAFRPSGGLCTTFGILDSFGQIPRAAQAGIKTLGDETAPGGNLIEGGQEEYWLWSHENRHIWGENIIAFDPADRKAREAAAYAFFNHLRVGFTESIGTMPLAIGAIMDLQGDSIGAPQQYVRALKREIDPANVGAASTEFVPMNTPPLVLKLLPRLRGLILSPLSMRLAAKVISRTGM